MFHSLHGLCGWREALTSKICGRLNQSRLSLSNIWLLYLHIIRFNVFCLMPAALLYRLTDASASSSLHAGSHSWYATWEALPSRTLTLPSTRVITRRLPQYTGDTRATFVIQNFHLSIHNHANTKARGQGFCASENSCIPTRSRSSQTRPVYITAGRLLASLIPFLLVLLVSPPVCLSVTE